jgi:hypothetical protein
MKAVEASKSLRISVSPIDAIRKAGCLPTTRPVGVSRGAQGL